MNYGKDLCVTVSGGAQTECANRPVEIHSVNKHHHVTAKIPVVLAELKVQINVHSTITLPEEALEVKRIKKRLKITQCRLIKAFHHDDDYFRTDKTSHMPCHPPYPPMAKFKLFLEGFVRKNIEYATVKCKNEYGVCGDIRHCSVDAPFSCVTPIEHFNGTPPLPVVFNDSAEYEYFKASPLPSKFPEKEKLLSGDLTEFNQCSFEYFNELPFCELVSSQICEQDEFLNLSLLTCGPFEERTFNEISEKMIIEVKFKILQNQQVRIPPQPPCPPHDRED